VGERVMGVVKVRATSWAGFCFTALSVSALSLSLSHTLNLTLTLSHSVSVFACLNVLVISPLKAYTYLCRVGQNCIYTPYIYCIFVDFPAKDAVRTPNIWLWLICMYTIRFLSWSHQQLPWIQWFR
jgi:hypothetical protein